MSLLGLTFWLLLLYQVKHFVCDYPLQTRYMLGKFKTEGWVLPLAAHAGVNAFGTFIVTLVSMEFLYIPGMGFALWLATLDFVIHFGVDRVKADPRLLGRYKMDDPKFWWVLGLDQGIHHLTHIVFAFMTVTAVQMAFGPPGLR